MSTQQLSQGDPEGVSLGQSATDLVGFHGATPTAQRASAAQAGVTTDAATSSTPFGFSSTQADGIVSTLNEICATLTAKGLWKGGA